MNEYLLLIHARLLNEVENSFSRGEIDSLAKLRLFDDIQQCFKVIEKSNDKGVWILENIFNFIKQHSKLSGVLNEFMTFWIQIKVNQAII